MPAANEAPDVPILMEDMAGDPLQDLPVFLAAAQRKNEEEKEQTAKWLLWMEEKRSR